MKKIFSLLLALLFSHSVFAASYNVNLGGGDPGAPPYFDSSYFPAVAPAGSLAVDISTNTLYVFNAGTLTWDPISGGGGGGVSSVGLSAPAIFSVAGSPVTTSGTLALSLATQSANTVFAGPTSGGAAAPAFRSLVAADIPALPYEGTITAGTSAQYWRGDKTFQTLDTLAVAENTNLYFTDTRARTAAVADAINDGTTNIAPSQNAVFDALALKSNTGHTHVAADVTDFTSAAKTAVVDDAITNGVTDKAPSQNAVFDALALKADAATSWNTAGNAVTGGKIGTTDAQNWDIIAGNGTVATIVNSYKGISTSPTVVPADATNVTQYDWRNYVSPSASTTGANHTTSYSELNWDNPSADFGNSSGSLISSNNVFIKNGSGTVNYGSALSSSGNFNDGTVTQYKGLTSESGISSGATVSDFYGVVSGLNTTGGILGSFTGYSQYGNFTDSTMSQTAQGIGQNLTFSGTTTNAQGVNGVNSYLQFNDSAAITNATFGFTGGIDLNNTANLNGLYGFNSYFNLRDNSDAGFVYGLNLGLNQEDAAVSSGTNGINLNYVFGGSGTAGDVNLANLYGRTLDTVDLNSFTAINTNPELEGTSVVDSVTIANFGGQLRQNATFQNVTGINLNTQLSGSAAATNFTGVQITPQITGTATLTNGFTAMNISPTASNTAGVASATGLNVSMNSVGLSAAAIAAGEKKKAIAFEGAVEGGNNYTVPGASTFFQNHYIGGTVGVAAADPIAAFGFGINLAQTVDFQDDWTADGAGLGFVNTGFVGSITGATGKTMYSWTGALGGAGNPSGAGTLTNAKMFSAGGILPQGGSLAVTNMYGFEVNPNLFCSIGTNCWGFYEDGATTENHVSKLAIGTSSKKVANSSTALEIGSIKGFVNGRMTTAQRNALTAVEGMQVYDTDLDAIYVYAAGSWVEVGAGAGGDVDGPASSVDGEVALFDGTTGKLLKRATGSGVAKLSSGVLSASQVDLTTEVTGTLPNSNTTAASANTASAIVARDASGNFSAGTITAALSGNASTATALAANPTDCGAGTKATAIDASGNLTCSAVSLTADVSGTLPTGNGGVGTEAQEVPTGTIDNSNTAFTLANTPVSNASVKVYKNGRLMRQGTDYTISGLTITFATAPNFAETLDAVYRY